MSRRRRIYLMRHSEVEYYTPSAVHVHPDEVGLTPRGIEQAEAAGQLLRDVRFDRVVTSGLRRTIQTAEAALAHAAGPEPADFDVCDDLMEIRGGPVLDVPLDVLEEAFLGIWLGVAGPGGSFLLGESIDELTNRVTAAFDHLLDEPDWDTMLLVGHGAVNRVILSYALTGEPVFLGHLEQSTACVNVLDVDPPGAVRTSARRGLAVRAVNLTPYDWLHEGERELDIERMYNQFRRTLEQRIVDRLS